MVVPRFGRWTVGAAVALVIALFSPTACKADGDEDPPPDPPKYVSYEIDPTSTIVALTFDRGLVRAVPTDADLQKAVSFAPDGATFTALGKNDTVLVGDGPNNHNLLVTFAAPLTGTANALIVRATCLMGTDKAKVLDDITIDSIAAGTPDPDPDPEDSGDDDDTDEGDETDEADEGDDEGDDETDEGDDDDEGDETSDDDETGEDDA
jgi:hypothetical protein